MNSRLLICLTTAFVGSMSRAADLPYGADTLPYLVERSQLVITSESAEKLQVTKPETGVASVSLYSVKVTAVQRGTAEVGATLQVLVQQTVDVSSADAFNGAILFLAGPLTNEDKAVVGVKGETSVYRLISGHWGSVVPTPERITALKEYVALIPPPNPADASGHELPLPAEWCKQYSKSSDDFLQRSAIIKLSVGRPKENAVKILSEALQAAGTTTENKRIVIDGLQSSAAPTALAALEELVLNPQASDGLRVKALRAVGQLPGGKKTLENFVSSPDKFVAPQAEKLLNK